MPVMPTVRLALLTVLTGVLAMQTVRAAQAPTAAEATFDGLTQPSAIHKQSFRVPGLVWTVNVKPNDTVRKGDELLVLDDREEQQRLKILEHDARSTVAIDIANARVRFAENELARKRAIHERGALSLNELEQAEVELELARLELVKAREEHEKAQLVVELQRKLLEQMRLVSMVDGQVEQILAKEGEVADNNNPAIVIARIDPLWVEVHLPTRIARNLRHKDELIVRFPNEPQSYSASVIFISQVSLGYDTQLVRLQMPNPDRRAGGLKVQVSVPLSLTAAAR